MTRGFLPLFALALAIGIGALAWGTEGFRVVTSEGARRLAVIGDPQPVPGVPLRDQDGRRFSLADYRGAPVLIEFIYTSCPTLCAVLGDELQRLAAARRGPRLLSISFDPEHDDRRALELYGERYGAALPRWRIAAPADQRSLRTLLQRFGVVAIPDGSGGFVHNGALYFVDSCGRIARILDPSATPQMIAAGDGAS
ncbi:MAG: SCO family protein [Stellaceae bacterium]